MSAELFRKTPSVVVHDNRALNVRYVEFHRHPQSPQVTHLRVTRQAHNARRYLSGSIDPRLQFSGLENFSYERDLAGGLLCERSVDSGIKYSMCNVVGHSIWSMRSIACGELGQENYAQASTHSTHYEPPAFLCRPVEVIESLAGESAVVVERFFYGAGQEQEKDLNIAGKLTHHFDPSGLVQTVSVAVTGVVTCSNRKLLEGVYIENIDVDWCAETLAENARLLSGTDYISCFLADSTGKVYRLQDCVGNQQCSVFDVAGMLVSSALIVGGGSCQEVVRSITYTAGGQPLWEEHGNGIVSVYEYELRHRRLRTIRTQRRNKGFVGWKILQNIHYAYDPVGNVRHIKSATESSRFWRNQVMVPEKKFSYDTLYQLVVASGRESICAGQSSNRLPPEMVPLPMDCSLFTNYTRFYTYDAASNLIKIGHRSPATSSSYVSEVVVSPRSNRGVSTLLTAEPEEVEALFTAGGQQRILMPSQELEWTRRGELRAVRGLNCESRSESYRYDGEGKRTVKASRQVREGGDSVISSVYLHGLEIKTVTRNGTVDELLQTVILSGQGRGDIQVLHWEKGKPEAIENNFMRWSYDDPLGSAGLEVDDAGAIISFDDSYPFGGVAFRASRNQVEGRYKDFHYFGKGRDLTGLYYFGRRYLQSWNGRWLSADPAGSVDGSNLYSMARNNPLIFRDDDGCNSVRENFDFSRGDLLYGIENSVIVYVSRLVGFKVSSFRQISTPSMINKYNDAVSSAAYEFSRASLPESVTERMDTQQVVVPPSDIEARARGGKNYPLWDAYFDIGRGNAKFNIHNIYKEVRQQSGSSFYHSWVYPTMVPLLLWKRGSKLGIEMAANGAGNHIHYALDDIDISAVVSKAGSAGQSVTASEIRYAFRNRKRLGNRIHFYNNNEEVSAPWVSSPWVWSKYKPQSNPRSRVNQLSSLLKSKFRN